MPVFSIRIILSVCLLLTALILQSVCFAQDATTTDQFEFDRRHIQSIRFRSFIDAHGGSIPNITGPNEIGDSTNGVKRPVKGLEKRKVRISADSVIVRFDSNPDDPMGPFDRTKSRFGGLSEKSRAVMKSLRAKISKSWCDGRLSLVKLDPKIDVSVALDRLRAMPQARYVVPNHYITLAEFIPNDPQFGAQWALKNTADVDIDATLAWDQTTGSATTVVAVMDTGIDYTHPDLYLAIALNNAEIPSSLLDLLVDTNSDGQIDFYDLNSLDALGNVALDSSGDKFNETLTSDQNGNGYIDAGDLTIAPWIDGFDDDGNGLVDDLFGWDHLIDSNNPMDNWGHGTHVTGIISARGDNGVGIAGVDWGVRILPERFHDSGGNVSEAIQAIDHAVSMGADVINASWGLFADNPALKDAIEWAGENGAVFVAAAGNHSNDIDNPSLAYYPAAYDLPNLISVASVDPSGSLSAFSNFGLNTVDIAAPGADILSTDLGGDYVLWSGTSMATPHVTGVVSLLVGLFPDESPEWLVDRVLSTAKSLPDLAGKTRTSGMVDAFLAVNTPNAAGPRIIAASPTGDVVTPTDRVVLNFDRPIEASTFTTDDVSITGPAGPVIPAGVNRLTDFVFEVLFPVQTIFGAYSLNVGPEIEDNVGRLMDQDRDGITGEPLDDRFNVVFRLVLPPEITTIDDGDSEFSTTGGWTTYVGAGFQGDFAYKPVGSGTQAASWTFSGLSPGQYLVSVTWQAYTNRTVDAPYAVLDGSTELATVRIDQREMPADFFEDGQWWQDLGEPYELTGDTLVVELSDLAGPSGSYVIADGVRIERVGELPTGPEIQVFVNGTSVADGTGSVDFGSTTVGLPLTKTITVRNGGTTDLMLGAITVPAGFSLETDFGTLTLNPGQTTSFTVQLDATAEGDYSGTVSFDSNDSDESPFDFTVTGTVSVDPPPMEPEIDVLVDGTSVADGTGSVDFGSTTVGLPLTKTITVRNGGTADLTLGAITVPAGFSLETDFGTLTLNPGQTTSFTVQLDADVEGNFSGTVSFDSNDSDESPFDFGVTGTVSVDVVPQVWVVDDGDAGFSANWTTYVGAGFQGDFAYKQVGSGTQAATWTFSGLSPGQYLVSVTWQAYTNRTVDAPYAVLDGSAELATVLVNQQEVPADFFEDGQWWQDLGEPYELTGDTLVVELSDLAGPSGSYLVADGVRIERVGDMPSGPEIQVLVDGTSVADGTGSVDFGSTTVGLPLTKTITVRNGGTADLTLGAITVPAGFSLETDFGTLTLNPGQTTGFTVQLDADVEGNFSGTVSFDSNDSDESPFDFGVTGTVSVDVVPQVWVVDDGDAGFSANWTTYVGAGFQGDFSYKQVGSGTQAATWTFSGLSPGQYLVSVTWQAYTNRTVDAPYAVLDGSTELATVLVNQREVPADFFEDGQWWQDLGEPYELTGDTLVVRLSDLAGPSGSYLVADGVRIERVGDMPSGPEIQVFVDGTSVADGTGSVDFGSTTVGLPLTKTITVRNGGTTDLMLGAITVPAGFSLETDFGVLTLNPGQTTSFAVQLDADVAGDFSGTVSFDSNDSDESPFDFAVTGTVSVDTVPQVWVVDDGDAGFSANWTTYVGAGFQGDFAYKPVGSGTQAATWTFSGLSPGQYLVSVTWQAYTNRAVDAPYAVLDGSAELATVLINQREEPADFFEDGQWWQDLGEPYELTGDTLVVELSDLAGPSGSYLVADGVRIERVGDLPSGPEIQVFVGGTSLADGTGSVDFGSTTVGLPLTKTITVRNGGTTDLMLGAITVPAGFSLETDFGTLTLNPGQTTGFTVQLDADVEGNFSGTVSFDSNDSDESPFDFGVTGTVSVDVVPQVWVVDDGDAGFSANWTTYVGAGFQGDFAYKPVGSGTQAATWTFSGLSPGQYLVSVTWQAYTNRTVDAPYAVLDGSTELATVLINQREVPADFFEDGQWWQNLGEPYELTGDTLVVELSDLAGPSGSYLVADGVRIERVGDVP